MWASNKREYLMEEIPGISVQEKRCLISEIYCSIYKKVDASQWKKRPKSGNYSDTD
ncbi:hypothetical protein GVv1_08350 [Enterobacter pseudoroggenkampii]